MAEAWYTPITDELSKVEEFILETIHSDNPELDEMCRYVVTSGGKRIRPAICILSYHICGGKNIEDAIAMGSAFEIVHTASLIHDDINDKGEIRRGRKTLHKQYCISKAIVAGDFMMARGYRALGSTSNEVVNVIIEAATKMSEGEFVQKDFEHSSKVTEEEYYEIITGKTSKLIEACAKSGAYIANGDSDTIAVLGEFAHDIGMAFQIIDDTLDVIGDVNNTGKKIGLDLIEGKPTLPTILAMRDPKYGAEIEKIFIRPEPKVEDVEEALSLIKKTDSIAICRQKAEQIVESAIKKISVLPDSVYRDSLISLAKYIVERDR